PAVCFRWRPPYPPPPHSAHLLEAPPSTPRGVRCHRPLSLHDALPIWWSSIISSRNIPTRPPPRCFSAPPASAPSASASATASSRDRKSTRLNSSHQIISYAVFCLQKKNRIRRYCTVCTRTRQARQPRG